MRTGERCNKLLTEHAKSIIQKAIADGEYNDRAEATEPPYMVPSPDASHYSLVRAVAHSLSEPSTQQRKVVYVLQRLLRIPHSLRWMQGRTLRLHPGIIDWLP